MEKIITQFQKKLQDLEDFKEMVLEDVALSFIRLNIKKLSIGNMIYSYNADCSKHFYPTYLDNVSGEFKPIYDKEQTFDFGWADFGQVARIIDVINKRLEEIKIK